MRQPKQFLIEGIDRMGKTTLIENLLQELGYHLVVHYEKPKKLLHYEPCGENQLKAYQMDCYHNMFKMIDAGVELILDRAHLGEVVYAPMYRGYDGDYVFGMERMVATHRARLVLLTTSDFSFIKDDGLSLDFSKKEIEQAKIIEAFHRSAIEDKVLVDVSNGRGGYKSGHKILAEVLKK